VSPLVRYADEEPNGLASMIGGLIEANLQAHPERTSLLRPGAAGIVATDAGVACTVRMAPEEATVSNGLSSPPPPVVVRADTETLTELTAAPLRWGFPDAFSREGRAMIRRLFSGRLAVRGLLASPGTVSRLNRLLSVA
jgi:hypothetical protein